VTSKRTDALHAAPVGEGRAMLELAARLYPICRSITGPGVEQTLAILQRIVPLTIEGVATGTRVFDWEVPDEWHIREAYVETEGGERLLDFADHNLHVLNYSEGIDRLVTHEELMGHLQTLPEHPDWIPYRTSYYHRTWGFCTRHADLPRFRHDRYRVRIDAEHRPGALRYGELLLPGRSRREVLFYTHVCHPSLANDNLSGMVVLAYLARELAERDRYYSYRFVWAPGTIGSITWLARNEPNLSRIAHGLVTVLLGRPGAFTYKRTRDGGAEIDRIASYLLQDDDAGVPFDPYGYDERQFGSPGIRLPVGRLSRAPHGAYPEYHTSADDIALLDPLALQGALQRLVATVDMLESNRRYVNLQPKGEPQLGKRGLYRRQGGNALPERENAMLWLLNQSDGSKDLLSVAELSGIAFNTMKAAAEALEEADLIECRDELEPA
jgi:aminopeptidase-like protein